MEIENIRMEASEINEAIKREMMDIWESEFVDSNEYISLIFDNYFDPKYFIEYKVEGKVAAILQAIPYYFRIFDSQSNTKFQIKSLYLCGLATLPEYRKNGIMTKLIHIIESKALEDKIPFVFLIPADDKLRNYYQQLGYEDAFPLRNLVYKKEDNFTNKERIDVVKIQMLSKIDIEYDLQQRIIEFAFSKEREIHTSSILHSQQDWKIILDEIRISDDEDILVEISSNRILELIIFKIQKIEKEIQVVWKSGGPGLNSNQLGKLNKMFPGFVITETEGATLIDEDIKYKGMMHVLVENENLKKSISNKEFLKNAILSDFVDLSENKIDSRKALKTDKNIEIDWIQEVKGAHVYLMLD